MPIWDKDCSSTDCESVNQTYIHELSLILGDVTPALLAPCEAWSAECAALLGPVVKRLESQATVLGRRVKVTAQQLDALGVPEGLPATDDGSANPPQIALEASGDVSGPMAVMAVQEAPEGTGAPGKAYDPKEPQDVAGFYFAERRAPWHQQFVAWAGDMLPDLRAYASFAEFMAVRTAGPVPDPPLDPTRPDIY